MLTTVGVCEEIREWFCLPYGVFAGLREGLCEGKIRCVRLGASCVHRGRRSDVPYGEAVVVVMRPFRGSQRSREERSGGVREGHATYREAQTSRLADDVGDRFQQELQLVSEGRRNGELL